MEKEGRKRRGFGEGGIYYRPERDQIHGAGEPRDRQRQACTEGSRRQDQGRRLAKMAELQGQARKGQITTGPNQTVGQWLDTWHTGLSPPAS